ncbi:MAG: P1 family peptidase [Reyranella sp.]|nr:P1 family peptidase [Reyranella sp.]
MPRARLRDLGLKVGTLPPGPLNAITDVAGVKVGYSTVIQDRPRNARTGVTAIWPRGQEIWTDYVFAGTFSFNGNGEMTGLPWIAEQGLLGAPIGITNTYQVGIVRDAITAMAVRDGASQAFHLPVVAETYDGWLSDIQGFPLTQEHAFAAFDSAVGGCAIAEGNVGGGTGMICHEFKGGTGTASRVIIENGERYTVGALVQANYGARDLLRVDGVPVGREIGPDVVPAHRSGISAVPPPATEGSIIVVLATDAPLIPIQCQRLARRATTGLSWVGGIGANGSGDIFIAFSTGNHIGQNDRISNVNMLAPDAMTSLFRAAAEATEEAILNAMCMAETMSGRDGRTVHALPLDLLQEVMRKYRPDQRAGALR